MFRDIFIVCIRKNSYISDLLLLVINNDSSKVRKHGETYEVAGVRFTADQIPKIDTNKLLEIKACNNIIDFGQNHYFKYVSSDGKEHALFTNDKGVVGFPTRNICGEQSMMQLLRDMLIFGGI